MSPSEQPLGAVAPQPSPAGEIDACSLLRNAGEYVSTVELDCGPPLDGGPAPRCRSRLTFRAGDYHWQHTDMVFSGTYRCEGDRVLGGDHGGVLDRGTGHLRWEGLEYAPARQQH